MTASALRPPTVVLARSATRAASGRDPAELVGETLLDRYRVVRLIGEGGMALVYAGTHTAIDRPVAIKVLRRRYADESDTVERFLREARASSVVRHEHVVEVTDFGTTDDGLVFMVMEYLEGETLADILQREGRMPWARVHGIALQICEALHAAHRAGVVHRDVTLRNCVRIRRKANHDYIKLLDFGIAKLMEPRIHGVVRSDPRRLTSDMDVFGTPEFMSPEQAKRSVDADPRSDIYATGVLLYALLTGRLPFEAGSAAEVMSRHIYDDVPPPSLHEPALPLAVEAVVLRALQKDPNQRFQSMSEFCAAIQAIPISATNAGGTSAAAASWSSPSVGGTTGLLQRRRVATRPPFLLGGLTALAVIALVGVTGWFSPERDPATPPPVVIRATSMPSPLPSPSVAMPFLPSKAPKLTIRASQRRDAAPPIARAPKRELEPVARTRAQRRSDPPPSAPAPVAAAPTESAPPPASYGPIDELKNPFGAATR